MYAHPAGVPLAGRLVGRDLTLFPILPEDHAFLYYVATADSTCLRWRFRGVIPPFEAFVQGLHRDVLCQFVARSNRDATRIGHVVCYAADLRDRIAFVGLVMAPEAIGTRAGSEAGALFIEYLFRNWDFRKLYFEVPEYTLEGIQHEMMPFVRDEGVLRQHAYSDGRYWDQHILAVYRDEWQESWPKHGDAI